MVDDSRLPIFPKVIARGEAVVIIEENGEERLWGFEADESAAIAVADEIQLGLRAINYVKTSLLSSLREALEYLADTGIPAEHLDDIVYEGYQSVQGWFDNK